MIKIESFKLHSLRNNEHFQFISDVDSLLVSFNASTLGVDNLYPAFKSALSTEDITLRVVQGSSKSKTIEQLDKLRDQIWNAISLRIKAYQFSPLSDEAESAEVLKRVINLNGDVRKLSYNEESAAINSTITSLLLEANSTYVDKVGIATWIDEMKKANDQFQTVFNERNVELSNREIGDVRSVRNQVDPLYQQIAEKINASVVLGTAPAETASFVSQLNEKISYYKTTLAARNGRKKKTDSDTPAE